MIQQCHLVWGSLLLVGFLAGCQVPLSEDDFHKTRDEVTGIALDPNALVLGIDADPVKVGFVEPEGVPNSGTWTSSDTSVVTVDSSGVVTPVGVGTATISAQVTTHEGKVVTKSKSVGIEARVTTVATSSGSYSLRGLTQDANGTLWASRGASYSYSNSWALFGWTSSGTTTSLAFTGLPSDYTSSSVTVPVLATDGFILANSNASKLYWTDATGAFVQSHSGSSGVTGGAWPYNSAGLLSSPRGVAVASDGTLYVADEENHKIRKVSPAGVVTTLVGNGSTGSTDSTGSWARFNNPSGIAVASDGTVYVADAGNHKIRKVSPTGLVTTLAGSGYQGSSDGTGTAASFNSPSGVAVASDGTVYVADRYNSKVRKITASGVVTTLAGNSGYSSPGYIDETGTAARFYYPYGIAVASDGTVYVADSYNNNIRKITASGVVTTLAGGSGYYSGSVDGTGTAARFNNPSGIAVASDGTVYVADSGGNKIRKITSSGVVTTVAGNGSSGSTDGTGTEARFSFPSGIAVASDGTMFVADSTNHKIRKVAAAGVVTTLAGTGSSGGGDGPRDIARLSSPSGLAKASNGDLYIADRGLDAVVVLETGGTSRTISGLNDPTGLALDSSGNLFVANSGTYSIVKVTPAGVVSTVAGSGSSGYADGSGTAAGFESLGAVASDAAGNLWVIDDNRVRRVGPDGSVLTVAGNTSYSSSSTDGLGDKATFSNLQGIVVGTDGNVYVADGYKIRKLVVKR